MNWRQVICYAVGCQWRPADDGSRGIAGAFKCARCNADWPAVVWPKAPPMPECKPPRAEQADRIQVLIADWERSAKVRFECADRTDDAMGKRVMSSSAFVYFNCAQSLKEAVGMAALEYDADTFKIDPIAESIARLDAHNLT